MDKKICWITSTWFLDVDIPIVPELKKIFDIDWIILTTPKRKADDCVYIEKQGLFPYQVYSVGSYLEIKTFFFHKKLIKNIASLNYDLYYFNISGLPSFFPLVKKYINKEKTLIATHNVTTPKGARLYYLEKLYMDFIIRNFNHFQVFSFNQKKVLLSKKKDANVFYAPLCLKDYGTFKSDKKGNVVTFLFFGIIVKYKRVDILLKATQSLVNDGFSNFKVKICGYCPLKVWEQEYKPLILNKNIVETDIRHIPNDLVPEIFGSSHYFIMPYQDIAQSGAMTIAFNYNLPIIASRLDSFLQFIEDGKTGYFFDQGSADDLASKMKMVLLNHTQQYDKLRENEKVFVERNLSNQAIIKMYIEYLSRRL